MDICTRFDLTSKTFTHTHCSCPYTCTYTKYARESSNQCYGSEITASMKRKPGNQASTYKLVLIRRGPNRDLAVTAMPESRFKVQNGQLKP